MPRLQLPAAEVYDEQMKKYLQLAKKFNLEDAVLITPQQVCFDKRVMLKCRWGCDSNGNDTLKCSARGTTFNERIEIIRCYTRILFLHSHDARELTRAALEIERAAFLDGYYLASAIRCCNFCESCSLERGKDCPFPEKIRPCDQLFGIDMYKTARQLGFPCQVLKNKDEQQNRYGLVLID
jgi:predicted metal-binding protein